MEDILKVVIGAVIAIAGGFASNWLLESSRYKRERRALVLSKLEEAYGLANALPRWAATFYGQVASEVSRTHLAERSQEPWSPQEWAEGVMSRTVVHLDTLHTPRIMSLIGFHHDSLLQAAKQVHNAASDLGSFVLGAAEKVLNGDHAVAQTTFSSICRPEVDNFATLALGFAAAIQTEAKKVRESGGFLSRFRRRKKGGE